MAVFVLRDLVPAGLLLGQIRGDVLEIDLDYVVPQYRDMKVGRFLFSDELEFFRRHGIREISSRADTEVHAGYLRRMGFVRAEEGMYRLRV